MASISEYYFSFENSFIKMLRFPFACMKYYFNPEKLSRRLIHIHKHAEIGFGKYLCEFFDTPPFILFQEIIEHRIAVNHSFKISPDPIKVYSEKFKKFVDVPLPSSHIGIHPVKCTLFSRQHRQNMVNCKTSLVVLNK